jgi:hypothetical protein
MLRKVLSWRPSHTTIAAYLALFIALGGVSYAAVKLPRNSVGGAQIKKNAVSSAKVKNGSLTKSDFKASSLPAGRPGAQGPKGDKGANGANGTNGTNGVNGTNGTNGADGTAAAFARVGSEAARPLQVSPAGFPSQVKGISQADVVPGEGAAATGTTCFDLSFQPASAMVAIDNADAAAAKRDMIASVAIDRGEDLGDCPASHNDARVRIIESDLTVGSPEADPGPANARFFIWFEK